MEKQCVVAEQFGSWLKAGGRRGEGVGSRGGGSKNVKDTLERQMVRVDRNSREEARLGKMGDSKDKDQDMGLLGVQEAKVNHAVGG